MACSYEPGKSEIAFITFFTFWQHRCLWVESKIVILNLFYVCLIQPATFNKWKHRTHAKVEIFAFLWLISMGYDLILKTLLKGNLKTSMDDYDAMNRFYHFSEIVSITNAVSGILPGIVFYLTHITCLY